MIRTIRVCTPILLAASLTTGCSSSGAPNEELPTPEVTVPESVLLINESNYTEILKEIVNTLNLVDISAKQKETSSFAFDLNSAAYDLIQEGTPIEGLTLGSITETLDPDTSEIEYAVDYSCDDTGAAQQRYYDQIGPYTRIVLDFDSCGYDAATYDGKFKNESGRRLNTEQVFELFERKTVSETYQLSGTWIQYYPWFSGMDSKDWVDASLRINENEKVLNSFNWSRSGTDTFLPDTNRGFVTDLEGTVQYVVQITNSASLTASFNLSSPLTKNKAVQVEAQLTFEGTHFAWEIPYGEANFPDYPVIDLGSPIVLHENSDLSGEQVSVEQSARPEIGQWQVGEVVVTADDGSTLILKPNTSDATLINVELNSSSEQLELPVGDGYQIYCPYVIEGCGAPDETEE